MKKIAFGLILIASAGLLTTGCQTATPPMQYNAPVTKAQGCKEGGKFLGDPYASDFQKIAMLEAMQNAGCLG